MSSLAEVQAHLRRAATAAGRHSGPLVLTGGLDPGKRLAIHRRHYETSLVTAICEKFPASAWLVGAAVVVEAAQAFVRSHPPRRPCIAEYGEDFPAFLARQGRVSAAPYLKAFAELEWDVGQVSIAVDCKAVPWPTIAEIGPEELLSARLALQPGTRYRCADWPVDDLMTMYLGDSAPDTLSFQPTETCVEIRGARGVLRLERIDPTTFAFRRALLAGSPISDAAEAALDCDATFNAGAALAAVIAADLVTDVFRSPQGGAT